MGTKNTVRLIDPSGTSYYLSGGGSAQIAYTGSSTPWTAESTSPYELSQNDRTPFWVPQPAPQSVISTGGPPFALGSRPLYVGYDTIQEQVGVQMKATTKDNAIALLNQLRQVLNTALFSMPCLLAVQGGTNTGYAEIYGADVAETVDYIAEPDGIFRATVTWRRAPFFSPSGLTTLQNGLTFTNAGTGANNNTQSLGSPAGDLIYEGSPLNIKIDPVTGGQYFYLATVYQRTYDAGVAASTSTSSTTFTNFYTTSAPGTNPARTRLGLRLRVMLRCTSISAKCRVRVLISAVDTTNAVWIGPEVAANATGVTQIDATPNGVPLDIVRAAALASGELNAKLQYRSTDGTSVTLNLHSVEYLLYYTFCRIDATALVGTNDFLQIEQAANLNGTAYVPTPGRVYVVFNNTGTDFLGDICDWRGTLPKAISGASLYVSWMQASYVFLGTDTAVVTTNHLPLFRSLRGAG